MRGAAVRSNTWRGRFSEVLQLRVLQPLAGMVESRWLRTPGLLPTVCVREGTCAAASERPVSNPQSCLLHFCASLLVPVYEKDDRSPLWRLAMTADNKVIASSSY